MITIVRLVLILVFITIFASALAPDIFAQLSAPETLEIQDVMAYRHLLEADDILYIVRYNIDWGNVTKPYQFVDETFQFQLKNDANSTCLTETAFPFHQQGYGAGIVSFYFDGNSTDPSWGELGSVVVQGTSLFGGSPPSDTYTLTSSNYCPYSSPADIREDMRQFLIAQILFLDLNWNEYYIAQGAEGREMNLLEYLSDSKTYVLSTSGEAYMLEAIPNLDDMLPQLFMYSISEIDPDDKEHSHEAETTYDTQFDGTPIEEFKDAMGEFMGDIGAATAFSLFAVMLVIGNASWTAMRYNRLFLGLMISAGPVLILTRLGLPDLALVMIAIIITVIWAIYGILGRHSQG